ncbi:hypothetical protein CDO44_10110 [Pigmentiphaga sp. NML080357]|uniref:BrnT family toxin n=1 Tax=Pigmentiphaga sp. NML080357 TaxID=2008675 RepID=UPI000B41BB3B|nr:BrnT family toxin [Pigmentiphaga sp. NML080357]OVZ60451.1 hypothetical protein CDO44_10110 [Pigmentiphaga sp. NML080357]
MHIVFDPAKDAANMAKHGVSLAGAVEFEWSDALMREDQRHDYKERRMTAIGYIGQRLFVVVYVDRGNARRIISLRKANSREMKLYAQA